MSAATTRPRPPNRRAIRHVIRNTKPVRAESISISVRKYGSQESAKCHQPARSPMGIITSDSKPMAAPPAIAPMMRRGVAREDGDDSQEDEVEGVKQVELRCSHVTPIRRICAAELR